MTIEFRAWPKIPRWNRDVVITEKIDGTNAAVGVEKIHEVASLADVRDNPIPVDAQALMNIGSLNAETGKTDIFHVYAQSRTRIITIDQDNFGFARWVQGNALSLFHLLGPGVHFGEWWGSGIQRGYGLQNGEKRFSLFNTDRHGDKDFSPVPGLGVVPILYQGTLSGAGSIISDPAVTPWEYALSVLRDGGSQAVPGFDRPEGIVIFHVAGNHCYKMTLEKDEVPKEVAAKQAAKLEATAA